MIKSGLLIEGVASLASCASRLAVLNTRGQLQIYRVKDVQALDSCVMEGQCSVSELLKARNSLPEVMGMSSETVYLDKMSVKEAGVFVWLTDGSRF